MKLRSPFLSLLMAVFCAGAARAAVLPPEKLLPKDTIFILTAPDYPKLAALATNSALGQLWRAPEMKAFYDKFGDKFKTEVGGALEKNLGVNLEQLAKQAQGQVTLAVIMNDQEQKTDDHYALVLLLDAKDRSDQLKKTLADVKKKWADASKPMKTTRIHDYEFTTFTTEDAPPKPKAADGDAPAADSPAAGASKKTEFTFGQVDSLLMISISSKAIEKIMSRQSGGLVPALEEQPTFQADFNARLRSAPVYAWINAKAVTDALTKAHADDDPGTPGSLPLSTILPATGLNDITSAGITARTGPEGTTAQLFVTVPEANRRGLIKAFALQAKEAAPPPFVPADAAKFWRARFDLRQTWDTLEKMLTDINPNAAGLINFMFTSAGKDKDEKYDLKSELLGNLGNDVVTYTKPPKGNTLADFKSAPSVVLIGSPNPDKLAAAISVALGVMAQGTGGVKDQDFLGRKIYSLNFPSQKGEANPLSFAASGGYVAFSSQHEMVEEYLRSNDGKTKPLTDAPGLMEAAPKAGGTGTGFFAYDNSAESMKSIFNMVHGENLSVSDIFGPAAAAQMAQGQTDQLAKIKDWADFSLLPPWDAVSKYFYFTLQTINFTPEGFTWTMFCPTPPKLR